MPYLSHTLQERQRAVHFIAILISDALDTFITRRFDMLTEHGVGLDRMISNAKGLYWVWKERQ